MSSKLISNLNPDAPPFYPKTPTFAYRSKNANLWSPARGWLKSYRCQACKVILCRKNGYTFPQLITNCGHITCAKCITTSYLINHNSVCPVNGCGKCIDKSHNHILP